MNLIKCIAGRDEYGRMGWFIQFPYDSEFIDEFKSVIDRHYRHWNEDTKTWWVDEECGSILKELFDNWSEPISPPKKARVKCSICNDKGLVPSTAIGVFSGKLIPNCWQACECHEQEPEYYPVLKPSDFDFSMSSSFHRSLGYEHGWAS